MSVNQLAELALGLGLGQTAGGPYPALGPDLPLDQRAPGPPLPIPRLPTASIAADPQSAGPVRALLTPSGPARYPSRVHVLSMTRAPGNWQIRLILMQSWAPNSSKPVYLRGTSPGLTPSLPSKGKRPKQSTGGSKRPQTRDSADA